MTMTRRYTTKSTGRGVLLTVLVDCPLGDAGTTREFWVPSSGGYVREEHGANHGTLGRQVCDGLSYSGPTLSSSREGLLPLIRREAKVGMRCDWW
jgi:hypothetical protein